jgi:hypothetical protein
MSQFAKNWADESDSEDEREQKRDETSLPVDQVSSQSQVAPSDDDSSDDDSENGKINSDLMVASGAANSKKNSNKSTARKPVSKKDQKQLKLKELDELDSLLKELGVSPSTEAVVADSEAVAISSTVAEADDDEKAKKKRKKKSAAASSSAETPIPSATEAELVADASPVDVAAVLKAKLSAKKSSKSTAVSDAQKIAIAEKSAADKKNKKKKDLSKFNEFSY